MEAAALYYLAAQHHVDALAIMTISDSLVNPDEDTTAEERQNTFTDMMKGWFGNLDCRVKCKKKILISSKIRIFSWMRFFLDLV